MTEVPIKIQLVKTLSNAKPSRIVAVKADGSPYFELWVTDKTGVPFPIKDETGGGGGGTITAIQNTDGNLTITGTTTRTINVSSSLLSLINSALQSGDNISELTNDSGYITLADIPTFSPTDYDLDDFNNVSADPFARQSEISVGGAVDSVNGQTGVVVLDSDDIAETASRFWLTSALKTAYDNAVIWVTNAGTNIRGTILTGLSTATTTAITATDTILQAFGKLQGQMNLKANLSALLAKQDRSPTDGITYSLKNGGLVDTTDLLNLPFNVRNAFVSLFQYNATVTNITFSSSANNSNNQCQWMPFQVGRSIEIDSFSIINNALNASAGANSVTLYIFDNSNDGLPGVKVHQEKSSLGVLDTAQTIIDFNNNIVLPRGNYWIGLHIRGLNVASNNPTFVGANGIGVPSIQPDTLSFTNNNNFKLITLGATADIGNNPIVQSNGSTTISYPIVYIKSILI